MQKFPVQWSLHPLSQFPVDLLQGALSLHNPWHLTHLSSKTYVPSPHSIKPTVLWNQRQIRYLEFDVFYIAFLLCNFMFLHYLPVSHCLPTQPYSHPLLQAPVTVEHAFPSLQCPHVFEQLGPYLLDSHSNDKTIHLMTHLFTLFKGLAVFKFHIIFWVLILI